MRKRAFFLNRRWALFASVSVLALLATDRIPPAFAGSPPLSPAALTQAAGVHQAQVAAAIAGSLANPMIQKQVQLSTANLTRAAQAFQAMQAAQAAATAASQLTLNNVPLSGSSWDGSTLSGLKPVNDHDPTLWINANPIDPTADINTATATETIHQTAANSLLTWQSFDLNKGETLVFDQQGHADWTVLNRIVAGRDPITGARTVATPSYILGSIQAPGSVYVINPNGIIFGATSQVNVHSLIASTLDVGNPTMTLAERNGFFLNNGISSANIPAASFSYNPADTELEVAHTVDANGNLVPMTDPDGSPVGVWVQDGAQITTSLAPRTVSPDAGGFVYLFAPYVRNDGAITTPSGETMMVAAQAVQLTPNYYPDAGIGSSTPTFRAVGYNSTDATTLPDSNYPWRLDGPASAQIAVPGSVVNTGLIDAERGVVILNGDNLTNGVLTDNTGAVTQAGVISADTSITRNGEIFLDARLNLTLAGGSSIQILPDENGETIPLSAIANFKPGSIEMRGNNVALESGSLIEAPGASVNATGLSRSLIAYPDQVSIQIPPPRIYMAPDSMIDVSGLDGVLLPMSANLISFKPFGNEFADQPLQRDGALRGQELTIDIRDGTALADVSGLIANVPQSLDQLLTTGGTVNLAGGAGGDIVMRQGSAINVAGGYVQYQGGFVQTTNLIAADGRIVNIANANPLDTFVGIAGTFTELHPHWGASTSETFVNPLLTGGTFEAGYVEGHDAGGITLNAQSYALDGSFDAGTVIGERQRALGTRPQTSTANTVAAVPTAMPSAGFFAISGLNNFVLQEEVAPLPADFTPDETLPSDRKLTTVLSADTLSQAGFGSISANFSGSLVVDSDATLTVAPGGTISLSGGSVDIEGGLTAQSGTISVESTAHISGDALGDTLTKFSPTDPTPPGLFNLTIGPNAVLDASGQWVNDAGAGPEALTGGAYVDGGTVSLKTDARSASCGSTACKQLAGLGAVPYVDLTGSIILSSGSKIDVSSGGRIGVNGAFQLDSKGWPAGKGGSVALQTYAGGFSVTTSGIVPPTTEAPVSNVIFTGSDGTADGIVEAVNSTISAFGFAQGGTLTVRAPTIQIGGTAPADQTAPSDPGIFYLPDSFFAGNAFGAYNFSSSVRGITVASDTTLALRQDNFEPDVNVFGSLPTGSKVSSVGSSGTLFDAIRSPVNLQLTAALPPIGYAPYDPTNPAAPYNPATSVPPPSVVALLIGKGAAIDADPGAVIGLAVAGHQAFGELDNSQLGDIAAQTAVADIEGSITAHGGAITITGQPNSEIWLGAQSLLDASGVAIADARQTLFHAGTVLSGGTVTIAAGFGNALIALNGAMINVSGASDTFDILADNVGQGLFTMQHVATPVWSDAGSINLSASTLLYDGSFRADPGAALANGGSLTVSLPQAGTLTVVAGGNVVPGGLLPTDSVLGTPLAGHAFFQADRLTSSGIANLTLSAGILQGDTISSTRGQFAPGTIAFTGVFNGNGGAVNTGNIDIRGLNGLALDGSVISLANFGAPPQGTQTDPCDANVCLAANYVALRGVGKGTLTPTAGTGTLRVQGGMIDIAAGGSPANSLLVLSGVAQADFVSAGDMRLRVPLANLPLILTPGSLPNGELVTAGGLTLQAAQIYPMSDVDFTLKALGNNTITVLGNGPASPPPLSAGGQIMVDAANIDQEGTLLAPLGTIRLGAKSATDLSPNDPAAFVLTNSVTLGDHSVTSVSLNGLIVPFGETANGADWSYDSQGAPLGSLPTKNIVISGGAIDVAGGATLDISGGGDVQAMEFVRGTGGTRDVLANNANVFAVIPGYNPAAAPLDADFLSAQGDVVPSVGASVFLSGGGGLPAGYYTLLPAHYATLSGAYRVALVSNSQDALTSRNTVLPDGTARMAGFFANPSTGTRSARTPAFDVQSAAVWRQYSEIDQTSGNTFFGAQTVTQTGAPPRLPIDAGHVAFNAVSGLNLNGLLLNAPAIGGRGSEVDIAAQDIQILSPGAAPLAGYLGLDATLLSDLGADSLLIGGIRSDGSDGETIALVANSVELSNDASAPLEAPEIILSTRIRTSQDPIDPNAIRGLRLDGGSVIQTSGTPAAGDATTITIGNDKKNIRGEGSVLSVSNGAPLVIQRQNADGKGGLIDIRAGATIGGGNALTLDTTGNIRIADAATFSATNISISTRAINIGAVPGNPAGFNVTTGVLGQLEQAQTLTLRTPGTINFFGNVEIALAKAASDLILDLNALVAETQGSVSLNAGTVDFVNSGAAPNPAAAGNSSLQVNAGNIIFGAGDKALSGFGAAVFDGTQEITVRDTGSLDAGGAALTFQTPLFLVGAGAKQTITTSGALAFVGSGANVPTTAAEIGGTLSVNAASISDDALIQATAGGVTLHATSGDITLGSNAEILANGFVQTFFDVMRVAGGGEVQLFADAGNIEGDSGAKIDISSAAGQAGNAGTIILSAANGTLTSDNGAAFDTSVIAGTLVSDSGGTLKIDAQNLGTTSLSIPSIFSDTVDVHVRQGDLSLAADLAAQNVTLTADIGTLSIGKTINASGAKGGTISLFGGQGVILESGGQLLATASDASKRGGDVVIGTEVAADNGSSNPGVIDLQTSAVIDVSNTANSANGGTVRLRAPLLGNGINDDVAIDPVNATIAGASSVTIEAFKVFDTHNSVFNGVIDPANQGSFFGTCTTAGACSGTLLDFVQKFSLSSGAQQKFASIAPGILHLQPGIELVNNDPTVNSGDITVASAWNLGAGTVGFLVNDSDFTIKVNKIKVDVPAGTVITDQNGQLLPQYANYSGALDFAPGISQITSLDYRVGGSPTGEAGTLTLRASRDLVIDADITDGFFLTQNRVDPKYLKNIENYITSIYPGGPTTDLSNVGGRILAGATYSNSALAQLFGLGPPPTAPYDPLANSISPAQRGQDRAPVAGADLFPLLKDPHGSIQGFDGNYTAIGSWSYRLVAGADAASANPLAVKPLSVFADGTGTPLAGHGNVVIDGHTGFSLSNINSDGGGVAFEIPVVVRTGTGSIDIAAGRDFILADTKAPGVVYTAGHNSVALPDPGFQIEEVDDPLNPGQKVEIPVATDPSGFLTPQVLTCDPGSAFGCNPYGVITAAAYPVEGGHLTVSAQQDILGFEHPTIASAGNGQQPNQQYFAPWLYVQSSALPLTDFGIFSPLSSYASLGTGDRFTPSQTSWWINFGGFDQGLMSVGGDVRIEAGRDISQLSVSLPTTARFSGGLSSTVTDAQGNVVANLPVMHLNKSGDLTVTAGRDILSGAYYEGSGTAKITAGGSVQAGWKDSFTSSQVSTVLAVDTGTITLHARGALDIAGIVSGTSLQNVADFGQTQDASVGMFVLSYGPASRVTLQSVSGDVIVNSLVNSFALIENPQLNVNLGGPPSGFFGGNSFPANFEATALLADVQVAGALQLAPSDSGTLNLLAYGSLRTFSHSHGGSSIGATGVISAGPSLVEGVFDSAQPLAGFGPEVGSQVLDLGALLLHQDDSNPDLFYAATGDIISGPDVAGSSSFDPRAFPLSWEVDKPAVVHAARDIIDLPFFGQNLAADDVTKIIAGRDIFYTGAWQLSGFPRLGSTFGNSAGLNLAGPGFFDIEAGRNLGPFVTASADIAVANNPNAKTDPTGTGIITYGNTVVAGNRLMFSDQVSGAQDQFANSANFLLPQGGATIAALFGVGKGIDYQTVINTYVNPANAATAPHNYLPQLVIYLQTIGLPAMSENDAWTTFNTLSPNLQHAFVDEIFFSELRVSGSSGQFADGYAIINALFPAAFEYTDNGLNGAGPASQVATGNLDMLHATIKTLQSTTMPVQTVDGTTLDLEAGGDVLLLGPGGNINVGATAVEVNKRLTNSAIGILTLDNGAIGTFTDGSVLVNQSRILTVQGGDIVMWSSNGDLDAGRGAKTTVDFKPLSVQFNPEDLQTLNLNGLVSGAGIGTIQSTPDAPPASASLFAPRGTVNAGDAGLRSSGNLQIVALRVLNAANIAAAGSVSGVPQETQVNLGALESAGNSAGQATQTAEEQAAAAANKGGTAPAHVPSIITVEVLGFGDYDPESGEAPPSDGTQPSPQQQQDHR